MPELSIKYLLFDNEISTDQLTVLGIERFEDIDQKLTPNFQEHGPNVTITKFFVGHTYHRWLVKGLEKVRATETLVIISPWTNNHEEEFLNQTKKSNRTVTSSLQFGTLVEVEFGFIPNVTKSDGSVRTNKRYPDTIHKGEMHKRRLCVVIKADHERVQVVPITSQPANESDRSVSPISLASLSSLTGYNDPTKSSHALCGMIKTVAYTRVLPPKGFKQGVRKAFRDTRYTKRLSSVDRRAVKEALSHAVDLPDYYELKDRVSEQYTTIRDLNTEVTESLGTIRSLNAEISELKEIERKYNALFEIMVDWRMSGSVDTIEEAREYVEQEIAEYTSLLDQD